MICQDTLSNFQLSDVATHADLCVCNVCGLCVNADIIVWRIKTVATAVAAAADGGVAAAEAAAAPAAGDDESQR